MASTITTIHIPRDPNTLSNYNNFLTKHTTANLSIDFEKKRLSGNVILKLESINDAETKDILLDTSHLDIKDINITGASISGWQLLPRLEPYGSALKISIEEEAKKRSSGGSRYTASNDREVYCSAMAQSYSNIK